MSFYNSERYQEKLNDLSPLEFRTQAAKVFLLFPLSTWQGALQYLEGQ
ncbi:IS3 family transposase [Siminovitchia fordii]